MTLYSSTHHFWQESKHQDWIINCTLLIWVQVIFNVPKLTLLSKCFTLNHIRYTEQSLWRHLSSGMLSMQFGWKLLKTEHKFLKHFWVNPVHFIRDQQLHNKLWNLPLHCQPTWGKKYKYQQSVTYVRISFRKPLYNSNFTQNFITQYSSACTKP
jgi:hypothetical protein